MYIFMTYQTVGLCRPPPPWNGTHTVVLENHGALCSSYIFSIRQNTQKKIQNCLVKCEPDKNVTFFYFDILLCFFVFLFGCFFFSSL